MSGEEEPVGLKFGEYLFGILIIIIGFLVFYYAFTSYSSLSTVVTSMPFIVPGLFLFAGAVLFVVGVLFIFAKKEEE
jgi:hypothetical protein